jgi:hypothetical protein
MSPLLGSDFQRHAQVAFASGQFWALVIVDFVMLVMRDVRITSKRLHSMRHRDVLLLMVASGEEQCSHVGLYIFDWLLPE